jgi:hypothetical protein
MILTIDGYDLYTNWGLQCVRSKGLLDPLKVKKGNLHNYNDEHGEDIDLSEVYFEPRPIVLDFIIQATTMAQFASRVRAFSALIQSPGLHVLKLPILDRPFYVYCQSEWDFDLLSKWNNTLMAGKLSVQLVEPLPVGRTWRTEQTTPSSITFYITNTKPTKLYWGDGTSVIVAAGTAVAATKSNYVARAEYFPYIAGVTSANAITKTGNQTEITT